MEELLDSGLSNGVPEGSGCKHVEEGVNGAADEDHGSSDEDHCAPNAVQMVCHVGKGIFGSQDDESKDVPDVMWCPANGKYDHYACGQDCGFALGLEGHLGNATAQTTVADHKDGEGQYVAHKCL